MARVGLGLFGVIFEAHSYWHYECEPGSLTLD